MTPHPLRGRDAVLGGLRSCTGGAVLVCGAEGIGKSALLAALRATPGVRGLGVRGSRAEQDLPLAALHRLFGVPVQDGPEVLRALTAMSMPTLCWVDDAQWVDAESLAALAFAARRLAGHPVAVVLASRTPTDLFDSLALTPLTDDAADAVLRDRGVPAGVRPQLVELGGGYPADLVALAEQLTPAQAAGRAPLSPVLTARLPEYTARLAALSREERARRLAHTHDTSEATRATWYAAAGPVDRRAAHALAAAGAEGPERAWHEAMAGNPFSPDELADELAHAPAADQAEAARQLARAADLTTDPALRAKRLLSAAEAAWQAGRAGWARLLLSRVDSAPGPVALLLGEIELRDGDPAVATHELTTAATLLPDPAHALLLAGEARRLSGDLDGYDRLAHTADTARTPAVEVAEAPGQAGLTPVTRGPVVRPPEVVPAEARTTAGRGSAGRGLAGRGLAVRASAPEVVASEPPAPAELVPAAQGSATERSVRARRLMRAHFAGFTAVLAGRHLDAAGPLDAAVGHGMAAADVAGAVWAAEAAFARGHLERAHECAAAAVGRARLGHRHAELPWALVHLSLSAIALDRLSCARAASREGLAAPHNLRMEHLTLLGLAAALLGDRAPELAEAEDGVAERGLGRPAAVAAWAHACLDLAEDRPADALGRLEDLAAGVAGDQPAIRVLATPQLVEAAVRAERPERAVAALAVFDRWTRTGGSPSWLALNHRCHALTTPDIEEAENHFTQAIACHRRAGSGMELARTQLAYAMLLRRHRRFRDARERFRDALRGFERAGAAGYAERARAGLRATGETVDAPHPSLAGLTPQQAEITRLVADGETNKEIARRLVISHRTVDHHLRNIFTALGVRSRVELARRVVASERTRSTP